MKKGVIRGNFKVVPCSNIYELGMSRGGPDFRERDSKNVISEEYILPRFKSPWILISLLPHLSSLKSKTFELRNASSLTNSIPSISNPSPTS